MAKQDVPRFSYCPTLIECPATESRLFFYPTQRRCDTGVHGGGDLHFAFNEIESRFDVALCLCLVLLHKNGANLLVNYVVGSELGKFLELCHNRERRPAKRFATFFTSSFSDN
jgi:hypothetical protein